MSSLSPSPSRNSAQLNNPSQTRPHFLVLSRVEGRLLPDRMQQQQQQQQQDTMPLAPVIEIELCAAALLQCVCAVQRSAAWNGIARCQCEHGMVVAVPYSRQQQQAGAIRAEWRQQAASSKQAGFCHPEYLLRTHHTHPVPCRRGKRRLGKWV